MPDQGYAIRRNGSCLASETQCGRGTWEDWYPCCPGNMTCQPLDGGTQCGVEDLDGPALSDCSNSTWDLYRSNGFFCCEPNQIGFELKVTRWVGCATNETFNSSMNALDIIKNGTGSNSIATSTASSSVTRPSVTASTTASISTSSGKVTSDEQSSTNTGAIIGGVVGGVCAVAIIAVIAWLLYRRRRSEASVKEEAGFFAPSGSPTSGVLSSHAPTQPLSELSGEKGSEIPSELPGDHIIRSEMYGDNTIRSELPANRQPPAELS